MFYWSSHTSLPLKLNDIEAEQCEERPHAHRVYTGMRKNTLQNDLCLLLAIDNSLTTSQQTACVSLSAVPLSLRMQDATGSEFQNQPLYH